MIEVHYLDIPPGIEKKLSFSGENLGESTDFTALNSRENTPLWATPELFGWPLDGSRKLLGEAERTPPWSWELSGVSSGCLGAGVLGDLTLNSRNAALENTPVVEVALAERCTVPGITFVFSSEEAYWCGEIELTVFDGQEVRLQTVLYPDSSRWFYPMEVGNFDRITVRLMGTNLPGRYAKLNRLYLGRMLVYSHGELEKVHFINEADPALDELTVDTMTVELRDLQERELAPRKDQKMELYRDGVLLASHGIESFSRQEKYRYTFQCRSAVGQLEETFLGDIYENIPVEDLLAQILEGMEFQIDASLKSSVISGYLPVCTRRQALQQVAFAVGGLVTTRGTRGIRLCGLTGQVSGSFRAEGLFRDGEVESASGVSRLEVVAHKYTPTNTRETLVDGEYFSGQDILLTFDTPHYDYTITGGTIIAQGANYIRLTAQGEVTVTACTYSHTTIRHIRDVFSGEGISAEQIRKVEQATLIHSRNVEALLHRLEKVYSLRQTLTQSVVVNGQFAGQQVALEDPFGGVLKGYIVAMESDLTPGGQTARITLLGEQILPEIAVDYSGMLYAGHKEVTL